MDNPTPGEPKALTGPDASAAAAAPAKAPETPARADDAGNLGKRRGNRVLVAIPIDLSATDVHGVRFTESRFTEMVSLYGASDGLPQRASTEHPTTLCRRFSRLASPRASSRPTGNSTRIPFLRRSIY